MVAPFIALGLAVGAGAVMSGCGGGQDTDTDVVENNNLTDTGDATDTDITDTGVTGLPAGDKTLCFYGDGDASPETFYSGECFVVLDNDYQALCEVCAPINSLAASEECPTSQWAWDVKSGNGTMTVGDYCNEVGVEESDMANLEFLYGLQESYELPDESIYPVLNYQDATMGECVASQVITDPTEINTAESSSVHITYQGCQVVPEDEFLRSAQQFGLPGGFQDLLATKEAIMANPKKSVQVPWDKLPSLDKLPTMFPKEAEAIDQ